MSPSEAIFFRRSGDQQFWLAIPYTPLLSKNQSTDEKRSLRLKELEARSPEIHETTAQTSRTFQIRKTRRGMRCGVPAARAFLNMPVDNVRAIPDAISVPDGNPMQQVAELGSEATGRIDFANNRSICVNPLMCASAINPAKCGTPLIPLLKNDFIESTADPKSVFFVFLFFLLSECRKMRHAASKTNQNHANNDHFA